MVLFKEIPQGLKPYFKPYKKLFNKPDYEHFQTLVTGLIVNDNKTLQEINDSLSDKDQSSLNRFVNSDWNSDAVNEVRLQQARQKLLRDEKGTLVIDDTLLHKTGKKMEKANYHRSGVTKKLEWGHCMVNSVLASNTNTPLYPVTEDIYVRKEDCDDIPFRTKRSIALSQVNYARTHSISFDTVVVDAGFQDSELYKEFTSLGFDVLMGIRVSTKISVKRKKRVSIGTYLGMLTDDDFKAVIRNGKAYFIHTKEVSVRQVGKVKLVISYKQGDEENIKIYMSSLLEKTEEELAGILIKRWDVECWHRDAKQHLGLESYQLRKYRGVRNVVTAVLVAYTLLVLNQKRGILVRMNTFFGRGLETIGELCRFMRQAALKGWRYMRCLFKKPEEFRNLLNKQILVKNAKV